MKIKSRPPDHAIEPYDPPMSVTDGIRARSRAPGQTEARIRRVSRKLELKAIAVRFEETTIEEVRPAVKA